MHFPSVPTSIRFALTACFVLGYPAVVWAHPGHGGIGAGEHEHWLFVDGVMHSALSMLVLLTSLLMSVITVVGFGRRWESLSWLGVAVIGCAFAAFHLDAQWSMWQQISYLFGSSVGALGWYALGCRLALRARGEFRAGEQESYSHSKSAPDQLV